jgi:hypothetical protein
MESCAVFLVAAIGVGGLAAFSTSGCSGPNPGAVKFEDRNPGAEPQPSPTNPGPDAGQNPGGDGGPGPGGGDSIFGTTAFAYVAPAKTSTGASTANTVPSHSGSVSGKDCIVAGCHLDNSHKWAFAGTLYSAATGGTGIAKGELRVVGPDGTAVGSAYTDADGNFWFDNGGKGIPAGSKSGARIEGGSAPMHMATTLGSTDNSCNANRANCHGTAGTGHINAQ